MYSTTINTPLIDLDVLVNDTDADGDPLTIISIRGPLHGNATINGTATGIDYDPDPNFAGLDLLEYTISDGFGGSDTAIVTISIAGDLYVSTEANELLVYDGTTGALKKVFIGDNETLAGPAGMLFDSSGDLIVANFDADKVTRYDGTTGEIIDNFVSRSSGGLDGPDGITNGSDGSLYVSSGLTNEILRYNGTTGSFIDVFVSSGSGGLSEPHGLIFGPDDSLYVASTDSDQVLRYNGTTGAFKDIFVSDATLDLPFDLVFGNDTNNLYVTNEFFGNITTNC